MEACRRRTRSLRFFFVREVGTTRLRLEEGIVVVEWVAGLFVAGRSN